MTDTWVVSGDEFKAHGWRSVKDDPPPSLTLVQVWNNGGARLLRDERGMWWLADRSMYVYYVPEWWKPL